MDEPLTEELLNELLGSQNVDDYLQDHPASERQLGDYLCELAQAHGMERKDAVHAAGLDDTYGYQLFTGRRLHPSRDKVLALALAMHLSVRETDRLLQAAGVSRLYCKNRRDAVVIFHLDRGATLAQANEALYRLGEEVIGSS